jgi:predicted permease
MSSSNHERLLRLASAWYGLLLRMYPAGFRARYGTQMREVFEDRCRALHRRRGSVAVTTHCVAAAGEVLANSVRERIARGRHPASRSHTNSGSSRFSIIEPLFRDLRFAVRTLVKKPLFTMVATITLALGIGTNTAIFSVVNGVLLKPLPYDDPASLIWVAHNAPGVGFSRAALTRGMYFTYRDQARTFDLSTWRRGRVTITGGDAPEQVGAALVTEGVFPVLRITPVLGRGFARSDVALDAPLTVILAHGFWQRRFGGDPDVIGRMVRLDGADWEVIGVAPPGFRLLDVEASVYLPLRLDPNSQSTTISFDFAGLARLRAGATLVDATRDVARMIPLTVERSAAITPARLADWRLSPNVLPLKQAVIGDVGPTLWVLLGGVGLVLLIACANVANLFLVRTEGRQREIAVRTALGASRARIARHFLLESLTLGLLGGLAGLAIAYAGVEALARIAPANLPRLGEVGIDAMVLSFVVAVSGLAGLAFGLFPVYHHGNPSLVASLKEGGRGAVGGRSHQRARNALVVAEVALALALLVGAGLMMRSAQALRAQDTGLREPDGVLTVRVYIPPNEARADEQVVEVHRRALAELSAVPGVTSAGAASQLPMEGGHSNGFHVEGGPSDQLVPRLYYKAIAGDYFSAVGVPLLAGRTITWDDIRNARPVGLVTENLARAYWGDPSLALGKRVRHRPEDPWREVIGVVGDVRANGLAEPAPGVVFWPMVVKDFLGVDVWTRRDLAYVVRTERADPLGMLPEVQRAVWTVNANIPLTEVRTLGSVIAQSMAQTTFMLLLLVIAAGVAVLLGTVGIYSVISYIVAQRTKEIGVRMALGARKRDVSRLVLRQGGLLAAAGVLLGVVVAAALTRFMSGLLFGVTPADGLTFGAAAGIVAAVALLACYLPARRAAAVDPMEALRWE